MKTYTLKPDVPRDVEMDKRWMEHERRTMIEIDADWEFDLWEWKHGKTFDAKKKCPRK